MRVAILGATSEIAKDLIRLFLIDKDIELVLFARRPQAVEDWANHNKISGNFSSRNFSSFGIKEDYDVLINFVGVGNPTEAVALGPSIFDVTLKYDDIAMDYLKHHPECRYVFLSSGAVYGSSFLVPVDIKTKAEINVNKFSPQDWYGVSKLHAECRHRAMPHLSIVDIRIFNYFSNKQNMDAGFLIADIVRAITDNKILETSEDPISRDYVGAEDLYQLVRKIIAFSATNEVVDCYSRAPIDKFTLLTCMQEKFGLRYQLGRGYFGVNATGAKANYYSLNKKAKDFGYQPKFTSLELVLREIESYMKDEL